MNEIQTSDGFTYQATCDCGWRGKETWWGAAHAEEKEHKERC